MDMDININSSVNININTGSTGASKGTAAAAGTPGRISAEQAISRLESAAAQVDLGSSGANKAGYTFAQAGGTKQKGLLADQVKALKDDFAANQQNFLAKMSSVVFGNQSRLFGIANSTYNGGLLNGSMFGLPDLVTDPEAAKAAISEGGDYSVGAVSDRIFGLAEALAGGDPDKLEEMRKAVQKGFEQAGFTFKKATGVKEMPEITGQTYDEIMKRFDKLSESLRNPTAEQQGMVQDMLEA